MAGVPLVCNLLSATREAVVNRNPHPGIARPSSSSSGPSGQTGRVSAFLGPENKQLLLAACVGYLLCLWQALCVAPAWPDFSDSTQECWSLDFSEPALNPQEARRLRAALLAEPQIEIVGTGGGVRATLYESRVYRRVDPQRRHPQDPDSWAKRALAVLWNKSRAVFTPTPTFTMASCFPPPPPGGRPSLVAPPGSLAARFESGSDGAASVGHTASAGTSYGTFQIASGTPTYKNFLRFLESRAPDWFARLQGKGPANTGSAAGAVPEEWKRIAQENPKHFEHLQYEFILSSHYRPALQAIYNETGLNVSALSPAVREVLWSCVVQHGIGGGAAIFIDAIETIKPRIVEKRQSRLFEHALIEEVYANRLRAFGPNGLTSRGAMANRYGKEKSQALGLLERHYSGT